MTEPRRRFLERMWWALIYGAAVLIAADRVDSWYGWIVVVGSSFMAGIYASAVPA